MVVFWYWSAIALPCVVASAAATKFTKRANNSDVLSYINPLIGSQAGGNVFAGATLPYGMVKGKGKTALHEPPKMHFYPTPVDAHEHAHYIH